MVGALAVLWVVDKKVVKHTVWAGAALVEVPIRVRFEFALNAERFVAGTLSRNVLYNRPALLRRFPRLDAAWLDGDIERAVDRALVEYLKFRGYASGEVKLFAAPAQESADTSVAPTGKAAGGAANAAGAECDGDDNTAPRIVLPSAAKEE